MDYQSLKTRHHNERNAHHPNLALRVHQALSWLNPDKSQIWREQRLR